mgnify:CR=1 FL=1
MFIGGKSSKGTKTQGLPNKEPRRKFLRDYLGMGFWEEKCFWQSDRYERSTEPTSVENESFLTSIFLCANSPGFTFNIVNAPSDYCRIAKHTSKQLIKS